MEDHMLQRLLELVIIINPLDKFFIMLFLGKSLSERDLSQLLKKAMLSCLIIAGFFVFTGNRILELFHVRLDTLRIVGGILIFYLGFNIATKGSKRVVNQAEGGVETLSTVLAFPLSTGPGFIAVLLTQLAEEKISFISVSINVFLALLILFIFMYFGAVVVRLFNLKDREKYGFVIEIRVGEHTASTKNLNFDLNKLEFISRFIAVLICCIGVQMFFAGVCNYLNICNSDI